VPACADVLSLAREALQLRGVLAAAPRSNPLVFDPGLTAPLEWLPDFRDAEVRDPSTGGVAAGRIRVPRTGRWTVWIEGSFGRRTAVTIDGRPAGSVEDAIGPRQETLALATIPLRAGTHRIAVVRSAQDLGPGHSGRRMLGPVTLAPASDRVPPVRLVSPYQYRALCGRSWDWIEIVRSRRGD
jgi:hypothetical protein